MESLVDLGYIGLFIGSFLASTIIPLSADFILIGILGLGGNPWVCLLTATAGNWLGGLTSYYLGRLGKWEWIEKWFNITQEKLEKQKARVDKYGVILALITWFPLIGDVFAMALGFYKVNPYTTGLYMLIGRFSRFLVWIILYKKYAEQFINWIS